ncbi:hypothetical protein BDQ17DRAFT_1430190 [Cyathus striatus]|nr:hypothetical protein BDQ17DRAFT_1430190 [Cyathus striatus]
MSNNQYPPVEPGHPYYPVSKRLNHNQSQSLVNELAVTRYALPVTENLFATWHPDTEDSQVSGVVDRVSGLHCDTLVPSLMGPSPTVPPVQTKSLPPRLSGNAVPPPPPLPLSIPSCQAPEMEDRVSGLYRATLNSSLAGPSPMLQASAAASIMPRPLPPLPLLPVALPSSVNGHHLTLYGSPSTATEPQASAVLLSNIPVPAPGNPGLSSPPDVPAPTHSLHFHMEIDGMASSHQDLPSGMEIDPSLLLYQPPVIPSPNDPSPNPLPSHQQAQANPSAIPSPSHQQQAQPPPANSSPDHQQPTIPSNFQPAIFPITFLSQHVTTSLGPELQSYNDQLVQTLTGLLHALLGANMSPSLINSPSSSEDDGMDAADESNDLAFNRLWYKDATNFRSPPSEALLEEFEDHRAVPDVASPTLDWMSPLLSDWNTEMIRLLALDYQALLNDQSTRDNIIITEDDMKLGHSVMAYQALQPPSEDSDETPHSKKERIKLSGVAEKVRNRRFTCREGTWKCQGKVIKACLSNKEEDNELWKEVKHIHEILGVNGMSSDEMEVEGTTTWQKVVRRRVKAWQNDSISDLFRNVETYGTGLCKRGGNIHCFREHGASTSGTKAGKKTRKDQQCVKGLPSNYYDQT